MFAKGLMRPELCTGAPGKKCSTIDQCIFAGSLPRILVPCYILHSRLFLLYMHLL